MFPASVGEISRQCSGLVENNIHDSKDKEEDALTENIMKETRNYDSFRNNEDGSKDHPGHTAEIIMRRKLKFYFMNPMQKWKYGGKFPFKLLLQVLKIIFVTIQLGLFATYRYEDVDFHWNAKTVLSNIFIKDWGADREVNEYPPSLGPLAVYSKDDFFESIEYVLTQYTDLDAITVGLFSYDDVNNSYVPPEICITQYRNTRIFSFNESYYFDDAKITDCYQAYLPDPDNFSLLQFFKNRSIIVDFNSFASFQIRFVLKVVNVATSIAGLGPPDCFKFNCLFQFSDFEKIGQVLIKFDLDHSRYLCTGTTNFVEHAGLKHFGSFALSVLVIILCSLSLILCGRAVYRGYSLQREASDFFFQHFNKPLEFYDRLEFVNFWYVMILINDVLIIMGSLMKEQFEIKMLEGDWRNVCAALLGTGNLLVWLGVLRYFGFFRKYNVLILTLKRAMPNVLRFLFVVVLIYAGFVFCGWVVLGPYHFKFRTLYTTSECLFSVINGDDMFATFSSMTGKSSFLWWYSRIYLYIFISLFIYVVLSLFIAVIMDAYETIKMYYKEGFPTSELSTFINSGSDPSSVYMGNSNNQGNCLTRICRKLCTCCGSDLNSEENRPLLT